MTSPGSTGVATLADIAIARPIHKGIGRCSETVVALRTLPSFTPSADASASACARASRVAIAIASVRALVSSLTLKLSELTRFAPAAIAESISAPTRSSAPGIHRHRILRVVADDPRLLARALVVLWIERIAAGGNLALVAEFGLERVDHLGRERGVAAGGLLGGLRLSVDREIQIRGIGRCARLAAAVNFNRPHARRLFASLCADAAEAKPGLTSAIAKPDRGRSGISASWTFTSGALRTKLIRDDFIRRLYQLTIVKVVTQDEWRKNKQSRTTRR